MNIRMRCYISNAARCTDQTNPEKKEAEILSEEQKAKNNQLEYSRNSLNKNPRK